MSKSSDFLAIYDLNMKLYIPFCNTTHAIIETIDEKDYRIIPNEGLPARINSTAYLILQFCDGKTNIDRIIKKLFNEYQVDKYTLKCDVINILYIMWRMNMVVWVNGNNPYLGLYTKALDDNICFNNLFFSDIKFILKDTSDKACISAIIDPEIKFSSYNVKNDLKLIKGFYLDIKYKNDVITFIYVEPNSSIIPVASILNYEISYIYVNNDYKNIISKFFDEFLIWVGTWIENELKILSIEDRMVFFIKLLNNEKNNSIMDALKFDFIGELKKECGDKDVRCYEKVLMSL